MRVAIMQPYFLPYIGYFQLVHGVDRFIVYDNIQYTKAGWINRNRLLRDGADAMFTLPLRKGADHLDVVEREISPSFRPDKLLNQFREAYRRAPQAAPTLALMEDLVGCPERNLFHFIHHSLLAVCRHLGIGTEIVVSSRLPIDHSLRGQEKVLALCAAAGADEYLNAIGGQALYSREAFRERGIALHFLRAKPREYPQFGRPFVPWLSILDVMMFNSVETIRARMLDDFELV